MKLFVKYKPMLFNILNQRFLLIPRICSILTKYHIMNFHIFLLFNFLLTNYN